MSRTRSASALDVVRLRRRQPACRRRRRRRPAPSPPAAPRPRPPASAPASSGSDGRPCSPSAVFRAAAMSGSECTSVPSRSKITRSKRTAGAACTAGGRQVNPRHGQRCACSRRRPGATFTRLVSNVADRQNVLRPAARSAVRPRAPGGARLGSWGSAGRARRLPVHARPAPDHVPGQALDDAHVRRLRNARGHQRALQVPAGARPDRPVHRLRHADPDGLRPRPPAARWARSGARACRWRAWTTCAGCSPTSRSTRSAPR